MELCTPQVRPDRDYGCTCRRFRWPPAPVSSSPQVLSHQAQTSQCLALGWNEELGTVSGFCQQPCEETGTGLAKCCSPSVSSCVLRRHGEQLLPGNLKAGASVAQNPTGEALASLPPLHVASEMSSHLRWRTCQKYTLSSPHLEFRRDFHRKPLYFSWSKFMQKYGISHFI